MKDNFIHFASEDKFSSSTFLPLAVFEHPYIQKKRIPLDYLKEIDGTIGVNRDELIIPFYYDLHPLIICSVQRIFIQNGEVKKMFMMGSKTKEGGLYLPSPKNCNDVVYVCEGVADALHIHRIARRGVAVAFSAGNLSYVTNWATKTLPEATVIVVADNDETGIKAAIECMKINNMVKCIIPQKGKDVCDMIIEHGQTDEQVSEFLSLPNAMRLDNEIIKEHDKQLEKKKEEKKDKKLSNYKLFTEDGEHGDRGIYYKNDSDDWERISDPIIAKTSVISIEGNRGAVIFECFAKTENNKNDIKNFNDEDFTWKKREALINRDLFYRSEGDWCAPLAEVGIVIDRPKKLKNYLLNAIKGIKELLKQDITGWDKQLCTFIASNKGIGENADNYYYLKKSGQFSFTEKGTLEGWNEAIKPICDRSSLSVFALSLGFLGPILRHLNVVLNNVFHFYGYTRRGKTSMLQLALSIWGNPKDVKTWNATEVGLEFEMLKSNDGLFVIDDSSVAKGKLDIVGVLYGLGNKAGKTRGTKSLTSITELDFRLVGISTGEDSIAAKIKSNIYQEAHYHDGLNRRCFSIPAATDKDLGIFDEISTEPNEWKHLVKILEDNMPKVTENYGVACQEFIKQVVGDRLTLKGKFDKFSEGIDAILDFVCTPDEYNEIKKLQDDDVFSEVFKSFKVVAFAGWLAVSYGIVTAFTCDDVLCSFAKTFLRYARDEEANESEESRVVKRFIEFLTANVDARFTYGYKDNNQNNNNNNTPTEKTHETRGASLGHVFYGVKNKEDEFYRVYNKYEESLKVYGCHEFLLAIRKDTISSILQELKISFESKKLVDLLILKGFVTIPSNCGKGNMYRTCKGGYYYIFDLKNRDVFENIARNHNHKFDRPESSSTQKPQPFQRKPDIPVYKQVLDECNKESYDYEKVTAVFGKETCRIDPTVKEESNIAPKPKENELIEIF